MLQITLKTLHKQYKYEAPPSAPVALLLLLHWCNVFVMSVAV